MNSISGPPFLVLLKHELGFRQVDGLQLILAATFFYLPWLGLNLCMFALGQDLTAFYPGMLAGLLLIWLMVVGALTAYAQVPLVWSQQTNFQAFEFLFTRAIDRRLSFRAKAAATLLIVLLPQLPGAVWTLAQPDMRVALDVPVGQVPQQNASRAGRTFPVERYEQAFPGSERLLDPQSAGSAALRIPGGWRAYAGWLAWGTTLATALLFAYYALVGPQLRRSGWWANTILIAPLPAVVGGMSCVVWLGYHPGNELFLYFRAHGIVCVLMLGAVCYGSLRWCEARFAALEIL